LDVLPSEIVMELVLDSLSRGKKDQFPPEIQEILLMPIMNQIQSEMQDVCSSDCQRVSLLDRATLTKDKDEVDDYWLRLEAGGAEEHCEQRTSIIEAFNESCVVGFPVDKENGCPLFGSEIAMKNAGDFLAVFKRVTAFRKAQAAKKRANPDAKKYAHRTNRS